MADGSINFDNDSGSEYVIFSYCGKTMIGRLYKDVPTTLHDKGVHKVMGVSDVYYVANPAEFEFSLLIPPTGNATVSWNIKPFYYKDLVVSTEASTEIIVAYHKSQVCLSNIGGTMIDSTLLNAYQSLCGK